MSSFSRLIAAASRRFASSHKSAHSGPLPHAVAVARSSSMGVAQLVRSRRTSRRISLRVPGTPCSSPLPEGRHHPVVVGTKRLPRRGQNRQIQRLDILRVLLRPFPAGTKKPPFGGCLVRFKWAHLSLMYSIANFTPTVYKNIGFCTACFYLQPFYALLKPIEVSRRNGVYDCFCASTVLKPLTAHPVSGQQLVNGGL